MVASLDEFFCLVGLDTSFGFGFRHRTPEKHQDDVRRAYPVKPSDITNAVQVYAP
jgi:hypothetical protein